LATLGTEPRERSAFYFCCRQQDQWLAEVTGPNLRADHAWFDACCPLRNVSAGFPSAVLVHSIADIDCRTASRYEWRRVWPRPAFSTG
jgi:hypothetical protein